MPDIKVRIKNLPQIRAAFSRSPLLMAKELNIAIQKSVYAIGRSSRQNTPVDTGRLRASTYEQFSNLKGEIGTRTNYDLFVHEGTRFMRARPYLRQAVKSEQSFIDREFTGAVQKVLDQIGRAT